MGNEFDGQAVLIFGGAGGIGSAVCRRVIAEGGRVLIVGYPAPTWQQPAAGIRVEWQATDVTDAILVDARW